MTAPLSIGIATRNRPDALRACLRSLCAITHLDPEILVFDDASEPPVAIAQEDAPAAVRVLHGSGGCAGGRNRLVREASHEYILLLDDDTLLLDGAAVEEALRVISRDASIGAIAFAQANQDGSPWPAGMQPAPATEPAVVTCFIGFAHLVRRTTFLRLGGYREVFQYHGEEKEFCLRLIENGQATVFLPQARVAHVTDPGSRDLRRYLRLVSRNDCLNSLYNDPFARMLWMVPARLVLYFRMRRGWKIHDPGGAGWVVREVVRLLPRVWRERRPVSRSTLARWRALQTAPPRYQAPPA